MISQVGKRDLLKQTTNLLKANASLQREVLRLKRNEMALCKSNETYEALVQASRRLATQYSVARILAESSTLDSAIPRILEAICKCFGWEISSFWSIDNSLNQLYCVETWQERSIDLTGFKESSLQIRFSLGVGLPGRVWASRTPFWITDINTDNNFLRLPVANREGLRTAFGFPILLMNEVFGVIESFSRELQPPDQDLLDMLATIGSQIGQFIERKRFESALQKSEEKYRSLVANIPDVTWTVGQDGKFLFISPNVKKVCGFTAEEIYKGSELWFGGIHPDDLEHVKRAYHLLFDVNRAYDVEYRIKRKDGLWIWVHDRAVATYKKNGIIYADGLFSDTTKRKCEEENRTYLLDQILLAQEQERRSIARELHDEAGPSLTSLLLGLRMVENAQSLDEARARANSSREITVKTLRDLKRLARGLHPSILDDLGLVAALSHYTANYSKSHEIDVKISKKRLGQIKIPPKVEIAVYRITQEALTNIARHAAAKKVNITLERRSSNLRLAIRDDGCGFNVESTLNSANSPRHLGLCSMRERVGLLGGSILIKSKPGKRTSISMQIPLPQAVE